MAERVDVVTVISKEFDWIDEITEDMVIEDHPIDSLDVVELTMALEEEFDIEIKEEAMEKWQTIKDIVDFIIEETK